MSKFLFIGGTKGGTTKTTTAHLVCLGAVLRSQPAAYVLTDPKRKLRSEGRPYGVLDGREPKRLAEIIQANVSIDNGWLVIDGGGNRPAFDAALAEEADLCLLPFRASQEDIDAMHTDLEALPHALAWPCAWSTNKHAQDAAQHFIDDLAKQYPLRVLSSPVYFVNSISDLTATALDSPSTPVRAAARRAFDIVSDCFDERVKPQATASVEAVA